MRTLGALLVVFAACGSSNKPEHATFADAGSVYDYDAAPGQAPSCPVQAAGTKLGKGHLLVGGSMDDAPFAANPYELRYDYLSGYVNDDADTPCSDCNSCMSHGMSCKNGAGGCGWWGCWQDSDKAPGQYVVGIIQGAEKVHAIPMISYYLWLTVGAAGHETDPEVVALTDGTAMTRYLNDWRFMCQTVGGATTGPVILQMEPDFWGYGEQRQVDPEAIAASVAAAGQPACAGLPDTLVGFAKCMVAIARAEAPHALVAFHVSSWGNAYDAFIDNGPSFDWKSHADGTAAFFTALGAQTTDLFTVNMSDRDAGFKHAFWDATNLTRPNFDQAMEWAGEVGAKLGLAPLWWQVPYGHPGLPNTCGKYEDNRVDYFFDHPERFAVSGALGIAFGAGADCMTTPTTDNGYFTMRAATYYAGTQSGLCAP